MGETKAGTEHSYPEHDKLAALDGQNQTIGMFLDWMSDQGIRRMVWAEGRQWPDEGHYLPCEDEWVVTYEGDYERAQFVPDGRTIEKLLADYFEIDQDKLETEKREMLESFRKQFGN